MNTASYPIFPLFNDLPPSIRALYINILLIMGIGYIFAMIQIYEVHAGRNGQPGLSVHDIQIAYSGDKTNTRLEAALNGPMRGMLSDGERDVVIRWARDGSSEEIYNSRIKHIIEARCINCHSGSNSGIPSLVGYAELKNLAHLDTGISISSLVRVSHIHLFGLTFIFGFMGLIFSHAHLRSAALKVMVISVPFLAIMLDIASWWLTKVSISFAYVVVIGGALMAMSFAFQWFVSFYQLCFFKRNRDEAK